MLASRSRSRARTRGRRRIRTRSVLSSMSKSRSMTRRMTSAIPAGMGFIAPRTIVTLKYTQMIVLASIGGGTTSEFTFNLNSVFAPASTASATNHQPYGFDQLADLYNRYRVFKTTWRVSSGASNDQYIMAVTPVNGVFAFPSAQDAAEYPRGLVKMAGTSGSNTLNFRGRLYLPVLTAKPREYATDDRYASLTSGSPIEVMRLHVLWQNVAAITSIEAPRFVVTLTYKVEFFDEFTQGPS